jgi:hypothetical protein
MNVANRSEVKEKLTLYATKAYAGGLILNLRTRCTGGESSAPRSGIFNSGRSIVVTKLPLLKDSHLAANILCKIN